MKTICNVWRTSKGLFLAAVITQLLACSTTSKDDPVVFVKKPVWVSAIKAGEGYSKDFPEAVQSEHIQVVNAGFWLVSNAKGTQVAYEFALKVQKPFATRVYSRAILPDPSDAEHPLIYDHYLDTETPSTLVRHNPVQGLEDLQNYTLYFEFYKDAQRTQLLERVVQPIRSALEQQKECTFFGQGISKERFKQTKVPLFCRP